MLLRVVTGNVVAGREADFIAICREQVSGGARAPGLAAFFCGYQRNDGVDRFVLASVWDSEGDATNVAGEPNHPRVVEITAGVATIDSTVHFSALDPIFRGIVDAPGGVIRLSSARVSRDGRDDLLNWLRSQPRQRVANTRQLLLGWALGERDLRDDETADVELMAISAWPSPLVIEAVSEPGRTGAPLFADLDSLSDDYTVEQFRAIALELPDSLADVGSRRIIAARFERADRADAAAAALAGAVAEPRAAHISVAPLGAPGTASDVHSFVLVARVAINEYGRAERLISDEGGEIILSQREEVEPTENEGASFARSHLAPGFSAP